MSTTLFLALPLVGSTHSAGLGNAAMASEVDAEPRPPAPGQVDAVPGDGSATVSWVPPSTDAVVTGYTVQSVPGFRMVTVSGDARSAVVDGLTNGVGYRFGVVAHTSRGNSEYGETSVEVVPKPLPGMVRDASASPYNNGATVRWQPPSDRENVTGYEIVSNPGGLRMTMSFGSEQVLFTGLTNGVEYTFTLTALGAYGRSPYSATTLPVVPGYSPKRVSRPTVKVIARRAVVRWSAPDERGRAITKYRILHDRGGTKTVSGSTHRAVFRWLPRGRHRFRVVAVNALGSSPASRPATAWVGRR